MVIPFSLQASVMKGYTLVMQVQDFEFEIRDTL